MGGRGGVKAHGRRNLLCWYRRGERNHEANAGLGGSPFGTISFSNLLNVRRFSALSARFGIITRAPGRLKMKSPLVSMQSMKFDHSKNLSKTTGVGGLKSSLNFQSGLTPEVLTSIPRDKMVR